MCRLTSIMSFLAVSFITFADVQNYDPSDYKQFPEYGCSLRFPDKDTWKWGDSKQGSEGTVALAVSGDGMMFWLGVDRRTDNVSFEDYIAECEQEITKGSNIRKLSAKKITFLDVPAYDVVMMQTDTRSKVFTRSFLKGQTEYGLVLVVPQDVRVNRAMVEECYKAFAWSKISEKSQTTTGGGGNFSYFGPLDYETFPKYHCKLRLPEKEKWKWRSSSEYPNSVALAGTEDGASVALIVMPQAPNIIFNDDFIGGMEKGVLKNGEIDRVSGQKCQFKGVDAYQLNSVHTSTQMKIYSRFFIKHHNLYAIQYHFPKDIQVDEAKLEQLYDIFSWIVTDEERMAQQKAEKEAIAKSYVFKEDTLPDAVEYSVSDAKTYQYKKGTLAFQIDISGNKLVYIGSQTSYAYFNLNADKKYLSSVTQGYVTNITSNVQVYARKDNIETIVKECKKNNESKRDTLLVKEIVGTSINENEKMVTLLFVSTFHDGEPCSYKASQFVQSGDYVLIIEADCAQGMCMTKEDTKLLNNIVQSALGSIQMNGRSVDTKMLANHVRKK